MLDYVKIGQRIKTIRKAKNVSQEQLAERVWISTTHMSHIETGSTKLSLPVLVDIANALQIGTDELLLTGPNIEKKAATDSICEILNNCSLQQAKILEQIIKSAKAAMDAYM